jgi:radical SAM-linked protein
LRAGTLSVCGPTDCHGCAPFARECVKGVVAATTGRPLDGQLPLLRTRAAPGPSPPRPVATPGHDRTPTDAGSADRPKYRWRARFEKSGRMRFLGHLDLTRMLLRALRRAGVDLVYSQGFNPKPKVGFSPALSVGIASEGEYLDFESHEQLDPATVLQRINDALPVGVRFHALREIELRAPALSDTILAARYRSTSVDAFDMAQAVDRFRTGGSQSVQRSQPGGRCREFRLDDELLSLELGGDNTIRFTLALRSNAASIRPDEVLRAIFPEHAASMRTVREELLADWNGRRVNPLLAATASHVQPTAR